ncbi:MAG: (d)CMP kinase, partial [Pseudomonadota bacterium]
AVASTMQVSFEVLGDRTGVALDGVDVSDDIPLERTGGLASQVAAHPGVRDALLGLQRRFLRAPGLVADGRDMGTVVFPSAECKVYLTASVAERAERRRQQLASRGVRVTLDDLSEDIRQRDERDMTRSVAPLKAADDALVLDSTGLSIDAVCERVLAHFGAHKR